jgi:hypothetical protein
MLLQKTNPYLAKIIALKYCLTKSFILEKTMFWDVTPCIPAQVHWSSFVKKEAIPVTGCEGP